MLSRYSFPRARHVFSRDQVASVADRQKSGFAPDGVEIGGGPTLGEDRDIRDRELGLGLQTSGPSRQDIDPIDEGRQAELDDPIESTGAGHRGVEVTRSVGRGDDQNAPVLVIETVHQGEQLGHKTLREFVRR